MPLGEPGDPAAVLGGRPGQVIIRDAADQYLCRPRAGRCSFETSSKPVPDRVLPMPLFHITLREHTYTGQFYNDVVEAGSFEEALQLAAGQATASRPPPGSGQRSFNVTLREHTYAGRFFNDVVEAGSFEEALQLAARQATASRPPPRFRPQPDGANRRPCADVWIHSLLHCALAEGHDPPHMGVARGYWRPVRWVRDDRGLASDTGAARTQLPGWWRRSARAGRCHWAARGLREDWPNLECAVAQVATWRGRRLKLRDRGVTKEPRLAQAPHRQAEPA